jgi:ribulose-5-phosphate 4-epimerase/fuculose-1-phosphate aldolase
MLEKTFRAELARISIKTYERGLVRGTGGNVSVRLDQSHMLITPSGVALGDTAVGNILKVNIETLEWVPNDPYVPSKEFKFHAEIFKARPDVNGIVHCHPPYATAYAVRKMDIPYVTDAAFKQPPMPHVDFSPSGSEALAEMIEQAVRENPGFRVMILDEHGIVAVGADLVQAYNFADLTEELAKIAYISSTLPG